MQEDELEGVWERLDDVDDDDWTPMDVEIVPGDGLDMDLSVPHGVFAMPFDAKPQRDGKWHPKDFLFFPPGQEPERGTVKKVGTWRRPEDSRDDTFPPSTKEMILPRCFEGDDWVDGWWFKDELGYLLSIGNEEALNFLIGE